MKDRGKNKSIFIEGFEQFIDSELVEMPFPFMREMEKDCRSRKVPVVSMATGAVIAQLIKLIQPKKILEIGTGPGFSLLWMLSALESGQIVSLDRNQELLEEAQKYISKVKKKEVQVELLHKYAIEYLNQNLQQLNEFDLVFVDCDKILYPDILKILMEHYNNRFLFDNVLWHGRISDPANTLPSDNAVRQFWTQLKNGQRKWTLFPSGDGLLLS